MPAKRFLQGQSLLVAFILTILAPGLLLAVFGGRALWQERQTADRQLRDRLDRGAEVAIEMLAEEFDGLQALVDGGLPPETAFRDLPPDGFWAYVEDDSSIVQVYPPGILPYELNAPTDVLLADPDLVSAERFETQEFNPDGAATAYRDLLARARPPLVPEVKHALARALRKTGQEREAVALWREVERAGGRIRSLPADLVAGFEIAAVDGDAARDFYRRLKEGRWRIEKVRYQYYRDAIQERIGETKRVPQPHGISGGRRGLGRPVTGGGPTKIASRVRPSDEVRARRTGRNGQNREDK